jgi:hypothetical protein
MKPKLKLYVITVWAWHNNCDAAEEPFVYPILAESMEKAKHAVIEMHRNDNELAERIYIDDDNCHEVVTVKDTLNNEYTLSFMKVASEA